jgi:uncharacterized membrane-anchored protein
MIRIILFIAAVALIATGVAWFADRPGDVAVTWFGYRVETSVMVALLALLVLVIALMVTWSVIRAIWRSPEHLSLFLRHRRAAKGYLAITRGLIAFMSRRSAATISQRRGLPPRRRPKRSRRSPGRARPFSTTGARRLTGRAQLKRSIA